MRISDWSSDVCYSDLLEAVQEQGQVVIDLLDPSEPRIDLVLQRFGEAYLEFMMTPCALAVMRAAVAEGAHVAVGTSLYENGPKRGWEGMKAYFAHLREQGAIRMVDPGIAARSEERRVGKECVSTCRSRGSPSH